MLESAPSLQMAMVTENEVAGARVAIEVVLGDVWLKPVM